MTKDFVAEFLMLVDSTSDGIETSYNAAGVLAHMASDGAEGKNQNLHWKLGQQAPSFGSTMANLETTAQEIFF